jgi:hypothetical protein
VAFVGWFFFAAVLYLFAGTGVWSYFVILMGKSPRTVGLDEIVSMASLGFFCVLLWPVFVLVYQGFKFLDRS